MAGNNILKKEVNLNNPQVIVDNLFELVQFKTPREKDILIKRFGLLNHKNTTLEEIGKGLGITRERVRQLEKNAIKRMLKQKPCREYVDFINLTIDKYFTTKSQALSQEKLGNIISKKEISVSTKNALNFILALNDSLKFIKENKIHDGIWAESSFKSHEVTEIIRNVIIELEERLEVLSTDELFGKFGRDLSKETFQNIVDSSKLILNSEGKWGLKSWRSINPKSIYDKIIIIFSKHGKPLHYGDITDLVNKHYSKTKDITSKAVHNELIKNEKFVLIGRGIYALSEWGYERGTVSDVIMEILREENRPLHKKEIIEKVKEKRIVKDATIIINLQKFKRIGKATYTIN